MESATRVQILDEAIYVLLRVYDFGKGTDPSLLFLVMDKQKDR